MAQSYQDYIKSLTPAGSTKVPTYTPVPQTGKQIVQDALKGVTPGGSTKVPTYTPVPQTGKQIVQDALKGVTPGGSTKVPIQSQPNYGVSDYTAGVSSQGGSTYVPPPPLSTQQSVGLSKDYGLKGLKDNAYTGLTMGQAQQKADEDKKKYQSQVSSGTSYTYNAQSISGFNDKSKQMRTKLDTVKNDAFTSTQQKKSDADAIIKSYTSEFAGLFNTPEEFQSALSSSPEIQKSVAEYQRAGGQLSDIASNIGVKAQQNTQTLDQYLGRGSTLAEQKAYDSLVPEKEAYQKQISFEQNVPEKYKDLYFGTPERTGILERDRIVAQEKAKNFEEEALKKDITDRARTEFNIQKLQAEKDAELATTEENRLNARNYATNMLAKMGALNTSSAAVELLAKLEQKYQAQSQQLRTSYDFKAKDVEIKLNETLNETEAKKRENITKIKEDLSKSEVKIAEEIMKLDITASRETFKITDKYLSEYRTQKEKYVKEAKAQAEKNAKAAAKISSTYDVSGLSFGNYLNQQQQGGQQTKIGGNSSLSGNDVIQGGQTFANPKSLLPGYLQALQGKRVSDDLKAILGGESKLSDYTPTNATKIQRELTKLGIKKSDLPGNQKGTDEVGKLSPADLTKGINYIYTSKDATQEDIEKFKTDRAFQAFVLSKVKTD
jgi:hypothetical protein